MARPKSIFVCQGCGHQEPRWLGRCPDCSEWHTLVEEVVAPPASARTTGVPPMPPRVSPVLLSSVLPPG